MATGSEIEPFGQALALKTQLFTCKQDTEDSRKEADAVFKHLVAFDAGRRLQENLVITHMCDKTPLALAETVQLQDLEAEIEELTDVLVFDGVAPLLNATERNVDKAGDLARLLEFFSKQNRRGNSVVAFVERLQIGGMDLRAHLANFRQLQLLEDEGGAVDSGMSMIVQRTKSSVVDRAPVRFRYYCVIDADGDGVTFGWDLPNDKEALTERQADRDRLITDLKNRGFKNVEIARRLQVHPSTVTRSTQRTSAADAELDE